MLLSGFAFQATDWSLVPQTTLAPGMSYQASDNEAPHRSHTTNGATLFIVD